MRERTGGVYKQTVYITGRMDTKQALKMDGKLVFIEGAVDLMSLLMFSLCSHVMISTVFIPLGSIFRACTTELTR